MSTANRSEEKQKDVKPPKDFDLNSYISQYTGPLAVRRLLTVGENCSQLRLQAFRKALTLLKKGKNTTLYIDTVSRARELLGHTLGDQYGLDKAWADNTNHRSMDEANRLNAQNKELRKMGEKEPIRVNLLKQSALQQAMGEYTSAIALLVESTEFASSMQNNLEASMAIIENSVFSGVMNHVNSQATRLRGNKDFNLKSNVKWSAKLLVSVGLAQLKQGNFLSAASSFLGLNYSQSHLPELLSPADIANYVSVCAMATYGRHELKTRLLQDENFKRFLDHSPLWRDALTAFVDSNYAASFSAMNTIKPLLQLDYFIGAHVEGLYSTVMERAFTQYFRPFSSVKLPEMADAFKMPLQALESVLVGLIAENKIQARVDSHNKVLYSRHSDQRNAAFEQALKVGNTYCRDVKASLLRSSLMQNHFFIRKPIDPEKLKEHELLTQFQ
mmetsp:Transcript_1425/g.2726  ORF Transcript_1425/g.2726 Transcript_1425/m.2726 type:complete len:444 (+) Transcript_1425:63-1394(+)|eukprot:CAMPEP_0175092108 /NCGR_PEP_ID=MMETSP0086_2-20121207/2281_1 /TAXON_ID=136419 /ORGANISM="Unknown Unknown, Strain D1" /LENGTH=443 /DNA_ID=CAMNT_0016364937 /DNA_START=58 /DNA_END=1389 /DNA_ORIENTATION=-